MRLRHRLTLRRCRATGPHCLQHVDRQLGRYGSGARQSHRQPEISGGYYYGIMLQTDWYRAGDPATGASNVVMEDLLVRDSGHDGIKITPKSNGAIIRRVEIRNTGRRDDSNADGIDNVNADGGGR